MILKRIASYPLSFFYFYKWAILTGILIPASYMPFPPWAVFFCFIPLWNFALKQNTLKTILIGGWLCQVFITVCGGNWMTYTIKEFGGFSWGGAVLIFLIFSTAGNLQIPIALALWFICQKKLKQLPIPSIRSLLGYLLLPTIFSLCLLYYPTIFKWHLGYTWFYANWPAAQTAEIWGFQFINTLTLFSNLLFLMAFKKPLSLKTTVKPILVWILLFATLNLWGAYLKHRWPKPTHTAKVLIVQPNSQRPTPEQQKNKKHFYHKQELKLFNETKKHLPQNTDIDFILWPEGSYPYILHDSIKHFYTQNRVAKYAKSLNTSLIINATHEKITGYSNSLFVFNKQGQLIQQPYDKIHLMVFGEYWPSIFSWIPFAEKLYAHFNRSFLRGNGKFTVANLYGIRIGFLICYEGLFDDMVRNLIHNDADILLNTSNDMWFGKWQQPWQHLYMTLSRAIEFRRSLVRGTNSGFSSAVTAKGDILYRSKLGESTSYVQEVPYSPQAKSTIFSLWGYYINQIFLWTMLFFCALVYWIKVHFQPH